MVLTCREKILSKVKAILADRDLCEIRTLEHWNRVMETLVAVGLADDESFEASKQELLARRQTQRVDNSTAGRAAVVRRRESETASIRSDFQSRAIKEPRSVRHAVSLRTLGQSLEKLRLQTFRLQKKGDFYRIQSESLTATRQWILRNFLAEIISEVSISNQKSTQLNGGDGWLCYGPLDSERLNALEQKRVNSVGQVRNVGKLAQLLYALGEHLDSKQATNYEISWAPDSVSLVYQTPKGLSERKVFNVGTLQQLALFSKFQKSTRHTS
jgi:hypothetical protein